jgi:hypothetical protein
MGHTSCSFAALSRLLAEHGGHLVAPWQVAFVTSRPRSDGLSLDRQHVMSTNSGTILIERAYTANSRNGFRDKVYWNAIVPTAGGIRLETLDRHRDGHYV